jgi:hypothetical protein
MKLERTLQTITLAIGILLISAVVVNYVVHGATKCELVIR